MHCVCYKPFDPHTKIRSYPATALNDSLVKRHTATPDALASARPLPSARYIRSGERNRQSTLSWTCLVEISRDDFDDVSTPTGAAHVK